MNKNLIFVVVFLIVLLIGGGLVIYMNRSIETEQNDDLTPTEPSDMQKVDTGDRSIRDLMTMSDSITCTYSDIGSTNEGTVYVSGGRIRGDFSVNTDGDMVNSHMISANDTFYIWSDDSDRGVIFSTENIDEMNSDGGRQNTIDVEEKFDYECNSWNTDDSFFKTPDNVTFVNFNEMIDVESIMNTSDQPMEGTADQCAACNSLSGEAKISCLSALGCE